MLILFKILLICLLCYIAFRLYVGSIIWLGFRRIELGMEKKSDILSVRIFNIVLLVVLIISIIFII